MKKQIKIFFIKSTNLLSVIILEILVIFLYLFIRKKGNASQYIDLVSILSQPTTILLISWYFKDEIKAFVNRLTGAKLPGGIEVNTNQQGEPSSTSLISDTNEATEFGALESFLALNSKNALMWFNNQKSLASLNSFIKLFAININETDTNLINREKSVIFSTLLYYKLVDVEKGFIKVTTKGERFLKSI